MKLYLTGGVKIEEELPEKKEKKEEAVEDKEDDAIQSSAQVGEPQEEV